jgi:hypothetical protein
MEMTWQTIMVAFLVTASAAYVVRRTWRTWNGVSNGCGKGCGCAAKLKAIDGDAGTATFVPVQELSLRQRKSNSP